jgi:hypothetical protein
VNNVALTCKTTLSNLRVGDYIWVKYTALTSGQFGTFSDIATKNDTDVGSNVIPVASSATPNGYAKAICVGYDSKNRAKLIFDRNIQHSISWDVINSSGAVYGLPLYSDKFFKITIRLMTGSVSSSDIDSEWDKIIVSSNLNNTISAGDNNVWNWSGIASWTSTTGTTSANKVIRGNATASTTNAPTGVVTTTVNTTTGFRPVLLVESIPKYLLNNNGTLISFKPNLCQPIGTEDANGIATLQQFTDYGADDITLANTSRTTNSVPFMNGTTLGSGTLYTSVDIDKNEAKDGFAIDETENVTKITYNTKNAFKPLDKVTGKFSVLRFIK